MSKTQIQKKNQKSNNIIFSLTLTRKGKIMHEDAEWDILDADELMFTLQKLTAHIERYTKGDKKN